MTVAKHRAEKFTGPLSTSRLSAVCCISYTFCTFVRERVVSFTQDSINQYLGNPLTLQAEQKCSYYKKVASKKWNYALVDVDQVISHEMNAIVISGHTLGSKVLVTLAHLGLIMELCRRAGVEIPPVVSKVIMSVVNEAYVERNCVPNLEGDGALQPQEMAPPASLVRYNEQLACRYN
ncbi:hypothetical protein RYX36_012325 [Vicia faba]